MSIDPWYKVVTARKEVREGRSFNPDEFAIHLEQVVSAKAPDDYTKPDQFFARTCFTRALREHCGMVLRRLTGETANTSPVMALVTQFGGGKTHTLTALYHLAKTGPASAAFNGIGTLLTEAKVAEVPKAAVGVFVGNAWDPQPGRETPWLDLAYQLAGEKGVAALGESAKETPPGTIALGKLFDAAGGCVLILCDEVLNFMNRHRKLAEPFHAFIQNLSSAITGTPRAAAVISLPRSQVEMTEWDVTWQEKIKKVVNRVAIDLIVNDEADIAEVIRRRLFEDLGGEKTREKVAKAFAAWCVQQRAQLPGEWTAVNTANTDKKAQESLQKRFEDCYPFHPATISVFQRKWATVSQFQKTRGTLAMLAQWIAWAVKDGYKEARREPLITLGSAPLHVSAFRSVVLGQLTAGNVGTEIGTAIDTDVSGPNAHARALDMSTSGVLQDIHRRVGAAVFFESSGGQVDKVAHLPELRFAIGEPDVDTTSVDTAAAALEKKAYYVRAAGSDGYRIHHKPRLKKVVHDKRAALDFEGEVRPAVRKLIKEEFEKGCTLPLVALPDDPGAVADSPRLSLVVVGPEVECSDPLAATLGAQVREWVRAKGTSPRLYPAALAFCFKQPGRQLVDKVENWLAWKRIASDVAKGVIGSEFDATDKAEIRTEVTSAEDEARDEVWASYRYVVVSEKADKGVPIDMGAGHMNDNDSLCARVLAALKSEGLLNETVGAGYIDRKWPDALKASGAWPLQGLRQGFLDGSLTRLMDPDKVLRQKLVEFVQKGDFGLASGPQPGGTYQQVWFARELPPEEVTFDAGVFLLTKAKAKELTTKPPEPVVVTPGDGGPGPAPVVPPVVPPVVVPPVVPPPVAPGELHLFGEVPSEQWNRIGTKLLTKLKASGTATIHIDIRVKLNPGTGDIGTEVNQILNDLTLAGALQLVTSGG